MMNKRVIITALVIAVARIGIASSISVSIPAEAQRVCGLEKHGPRASFLVKGGQGEEIGEFVSGLAQEINLGQVVVRL